MGLDADIPLRSNAGKVVAAWWNILRTVILSLFGNEGIQQTSVTLTDNTTAPANVTGLVFTTAKTTSALVIGEIKRGSDFQIRKWIVTYDGSSWDISVYGTSVGADTGVTLSISSGQVQYTTTNTGSNATFKFKTGWVVNV